MKYILSIFLSLYVSYACAAPTVFGVSGTLSAGQAVTVSGSLFGTKLTAAPIRFETFPGSHGAKVSNMGWWSTKDNNSAYSPVIRADVSRVAGRNIADLSTDQNTAINMFRNNIGFKATRKAYVNAWFYLGINGFDHVSTQMKLLNINRNTDLASNNEYPDQATSLWSKMNGETYGTVSRYYNGGGSAPTLSYKTSEGANLGIFAVTGWYNFVVQVDQGTMGLTDGKTTISLVGPGYSKYGITSDTATVMQIDGGDYLDSLKIWQYLQNRDTYSDFLSYKNAYSAGYTVNARVTYMGKSYRCIVDTGPKESIVDGPDVDVAHWVKISDAPIVLSDTVYVDSVYIDSSFARVEIGDSSNYLNCTHREVQIPTAWADASIVFTVNSGSFPAGSPVYVFVIDEAGNVSSGYGPLTIGGAVDTIAPTTTTTPPAKRANTATSVTLTASESATIYYTTDGSTPTTGSTQYASPLSIKPGTTLKYFAKDTANNSEGIQSQYYGWPVLCR